MTCWAGMGYNEREGDDRLRKLSLICAFGLLMALVFAARAESVPLDAAHFPDARFRAYLAKTFDGDGDGSLSDGERDAVRVLWLQEKGIASLEGIGCFPLLESLACWGNELTELDLRGNPLLRDVACGKNRLTKLNVDGCLLLEDLACFDNRLTFLDVSGNPALRYLSCQGNPLTGIALGDRSRLYMLEIDSMPGDINGDYTVDGRDLLRLARYLAGQAIAVDESAADVNGDGNIDGRDALRLAKRLAGN